MQKIHPLMLAAVIAFWGWQAEQWLIAAPVAALLCASFYVPLRWALTTAHLIRVSDFCMVLALFTGVLLYVSYGNPVAVVVFFKWLPVMLLPVALAHAYSTAERMDLRVLFWSLRRRWAHHRPRAATFDPWWPYYAMWIIAAATANRRDAWFDIGLAALVGWPLVPQVRIRRPWSYRVGTWGAAFSLALVLGYGLHHGLSTAQGWLENAVPDWLSGDGSRTDPYRATTDIGHIGKLKDSAAIVLRVTMPDGAYGSKAPALLHRASYNTYFGATWLARNVTFAPLTAALNDRWPLAAETPAPVRITIHDYSERPNPVLSLPTGTSAIENLKAITVQRNALGAVQIVREPGFFSYTAAYLGTAVGEAVALDGAPTADDLRLPAKEREAYAAVATELGLSAQAAAAGVERVKYFFANGYQYSTFQKDAPIAGSPMVDFLHRSKTGHCEYFATATALLLRAGGIPARYATGFAVSEKSDRQIANESAYIVRQRHAHAWVRAYVNGTWIDIDTTPPSWIAAEAESSAWWSALSDLSDRWSWLRFRASRAWASADERQWIAGALVIVFPFALWLAWRLYRSRRTHKNNQQNQTVTEIDRAGRDSDFYRVEQHLNEQGRGRRPDETTHDWLARLSTAATLDTTALAEIIELHNRYRFDPAGLSSAQRQRLRACADGWLASERS
jgi:hypothetical protein